MRSPTIDRETIYYKLNLLSHFVGHMGSEKYYSDFEEDDFFAMSVLLYGIAKEIYPECKDPEEPEQDAP